MDSCVVNEHDIVEHDGSLRCNYPCVRWPNLLTEHKEATIWLEGEFTLADLMQLTAYLLQQKAEGKWPTL